MSKWFIKFTANFDAEKLLNYNLSHYIECHLVMLLFIEFDLIYCKLFLLAFALW